MSQTLLQARYGSPQTTAHAAPLNATLQTLLSHRSVRAFLPDAVSAETLSVLIAAAQSAATSSNLQAWSVVAVQDPPCKQRLAALAANQAHIKEAPLLLVFLADLSRLERTADRQQQTVGGLQYLESFLLAAIDAALAAQNVVAAAESLGLGTVYIGAIRNQPEAVAAELKLPPQVFPVFGLVVGTPDPLRPASVKPRLPQSVVLHHEQYESAPEAAAIASYDEVLKAFYASQGLPPVPWSQHVLGRVKDAAALNGRDRLAQAARTLGFGLV
ncbi:NADPH-dependent oxidoreductase [Silvimonas amylolytica]|uniref:NADPH-dependent oxidoreductase n=1 Tax=Silvimonas amylolytica TaxID=449663 RepID=A0ABQ2PNY1_9NEIS|nr:NADPH-dependent oxidoreductase [Silvimonas amylolytica]GGP27167.1 NADPH-dependent oxidoreductase [Silvimonas amylolytica]